MEAVTMAGLLSNVSLIVTECISWITSFVGAITANPIIELFVLFGLLGTGIGLVGRLIRLG